MRVITGVAIIAIVSFLVVSWNNNKEDKTRLSSQELQELQVLQDLAAGKPVKLDLLRSTLVTHQMMVNGEALQGLVRRTGSKNLPADYSSAMILLKTENLSVVYTGDPNKISSVWRPVVATQPATAPALAPEPN